MARPPRGWTEEQWEEHLRYQRELSGLRTSRRRPSYVEYVTDPETGKQIPRGDRGVLVEEEPEEPLTRAQLRERAYAEAKFMQDYRKAEKASKEKMQQMKLRKQFVLSIKPIYPISLRSRQVKFDGAADICVGSDFHLRAQARGTAYTKKGRKSYTGGRVDINDVPKTTIQEYSKQIEQEPSRLGFLKDTRKKRNEQEDPNLRVVYPNGELQQKKIQSIEQCERISRNLLLCVDKAKRSNSDMCELVMESYKCGADEGSEFSATQMAGITGLPARDVRGCITTEMFRSQRLKPTGKMVIAEEKYTVKT